MTEKIRRGQFVVVHDVPGAEWRGDQPEEWNTAATQQWLIVRDAIEKSRDLLPRFAVFSLAPTPLAAHLGFLFSDRVEVRAFQFDRDRSEWTWPSNDDGEDVKFAKTGLPVSQVTESCEVALRISISARVSEADAKAGAAVAGYHVELHVPEPSKTWLRSGARLRAATKAIHDVLMALRDCFPECSAIHVFAAVPTPVAIALGQAVNPRMDPPVALYEYARQRAPRYRFALMLGEVVRKVDKSGGLTA